LGACLLPGLHTLGFSAHPALICRYLVAACGESGLINGLVHIGIGLFFLLSREVCREV